MATFNNGESGLSVRNKINEAIDKVDGNSAFDNDIDVNGNVSIGDNYQILLGASNDLTIEHNSTNGVITNNTNHLYIQNAANDKDIYLQTDNGSGGATNYFAADGSSGEAKMYYYGSEKLNTKSSGVDITGNLATSDKIIAKVVTYASNQNAPYMIAATTSYTGAPTNAGTYGLQHRYKYDSGGSSRITVDGAIGGVGTELWALYGGTGNMDVYGSLDVGGNLFLPANGEMRFGGNNGIIIEHTGSFADIRNGSGHMYIRNFADDSDVYIQSDNGSGATTNYFVADGSTGEAKMYYYGSEKLNTSSSGVDVTGAVTMAAADPYIKMTDTSTGVDHEIDANSGVGNLVINADINAEGSEPKLLLKVTGTTGITVRDTGNVDIASDLSVGRHVYLGDNSELRFGYSNDLIIEHNASNGDIRNNTNDLLIRNLADDRDVIIQSDDGSGGTADYFRADGSSGEAKLFYYGSEKLNTSSGGVDVTGLTATDSLQVITNNNTQQGNVKLGRNGTQYIDFHGGSSGNFITSVSTSETAKPLYLRVNAGATNENFIFGHDGNLTVPGALSKGSGSFKIDHPLKPTSHHLVHSFVEAPQADNIYRGKVALIGGSATVNLDEAGRMTEGTFVALNGNIQCFTSNEDGWAAIRGSVSGNTLTIEAQDVSCTDTASWLVIGERHDPHMLDTDWTDEAGRVITEPEKQAEEDE